MNNEKWGRGRQGFLKFPFLLNGCGTRYFHNYDFFSPCLSRNKNNLRVAHQNKASPLTRVFLHLLQYGQSNRDTWKKICQSQRFLKTKDSLYYSKTRMAHIKQTRIIKQTRVTKSPKLFLAHIPVKTNLYLADCD